MFGIAMPPVLPGEAGGVEGTLATIGVVLVGAGAWIWATARARRPAEDATVYPAAPQERKAA